MTATDVVSATLIAGILLFMIAVLRVILAVYLGRGLSWARMIITVLVIMNLLAGVAYVFQDDFWRGLPTIGLELVVLWLLYNESSNLSPAHARPSSLREPLRQRIAQQHDIADGLRLGQRGASTGVPRELAVSDESLAAESPTKNGAMTRCSSSARSAVRNCVCIVPPPSTISRWMPRA